MVYMYLTEGKTVDVSEILHKDMYQLHVVGIAPVKTNICATEEIVPATFLTHLSITGRFTVHKNLIVAISKAMREEKLPRLQNLCFAGADVTGEMQDLFSGETVLSNVTHLNFSTGMFYQDLQALYLASKNSLLPKLTSLAVSDDKFPLKPGGINYFDYNWINLTSLSVKDVTKWGFRQLYKAIRQSRLTHLIKLCVSVTQNEKCGLKKIKPEKIPLMEHLCVQRCITSKKGLKHLSCLIKCWSLQSLDISHSRGVKENLSVLMGRPIASLQNLILHDCELNKEDLISLVRANEEGRLSNLENLDLSENRLLVENFDTISSKWRSLKTPRINYEP